MLGKFYFWIKLFGNFFLSNSIRVGIVITCCLPCPLKLQESIKDSKVPFAFHSAISKCHLFLCLLRFWNIQQWILNWPPIYQKLHKISYFTLWDTFGLICVSDLIILLTSHQWDFWVTPQFVIDNSSLVLSRVSHESGKFN